MYNCMCVYLVLCVDFEDAESAALLGEKNTLRHLKADL